MRINFPRPSNTRHTGTLQPISGRVTGPLILFEDPQVPLEAASRQYTDLAFATLSASSLTTGTIPAARLPAFTGECSIPAGTSNITLNNTGVVAGTYYKVTVDGVGRVTASNVFSIGDIPDFGWNKIVSGLPNSLAGYGIDSAIPISGGMITGSLSVQTAPTLDFHVANKAYVDSKVSGGATYVAGDIIKTITPNTPTGFLKLNGAQLSKTTYADLYTVIGDAFTNTGLEPGAGQPWRYQYDINTTQSGDISAWTTEAPFPVSLDEANVVVTKNRVYILGNNNVGVRDQIYYADINENGSLSTWTLDTNVLPNGGLYATHVITIKNKVHLIGGRYVAGNTHYYGGNIYSTSIDANGHLGSWTITNAGTNSGEGSVFITKNKVYIVAYRDSSSSWTTSTIYYPINSDGSLGSFAHGPTLPVAMNYSNLIVTKNRVYLFGGRSASMDFSTNSYLYSYTAAIDSEGTLGAWTTHSGSLPVNLSMAATVMTKNTAYILGGYQQTSAGRVSSNVVYRATINTDGTLGTWSTGTVLPAGHGNISVAFFVKNKLYLMSTGTTAVYSAVTSGGLNDYSPYYDGSLSPVATGFYKLPNYTSKETSGKYYFIKY